MASYKVQIKWGKNKYDVECNTGEPPIVFKAQMFELTGVQPERQKVMFKAKVLSDDDWAGFPELKPGAQLMMMGSADAIPEAPAVKHKFAEDLTEGELSKAMNLPAGLKNLGNTCYLNATLQCLKSVPALRDALNKYNRRINIASASDFDPSSAVTSAIKDVFNGMDRTNEEFFIPLVMVQILHMAFPRFAEKGERGEPMQQDANECWVELTRMLQQALTGEGETPISTITKYFGGEFSVTTKCKENETEEATHSKEQFLQLSCYLSQEVKYMHTGLKARLHEEITKRSPTLDRDAVYEKDAKISRLPAHLTIQFVRFQYKENVQTNAKILKEIKFSGTLDVFDMCTEELREKLRPYRENFKQYDEDLMELTRLRKIHGHGDGRDSDAVSETAKPFDRNASEDLSSFESFSLEGDPGSNNSGFYELQAVLTHKGRSSNSGHYVGWVKRPGGPYPENASWLMCDDEHVVIVGLEDILKLAGGGDWHCAYVLIYGPKMMPLNALETVKADIAKIHELSKENVPDENGSVPMALD